MGDKSGIAPTIGQLGRLAEAQGDYEDALRNYLTSLTMFQELKSHYTETVLNDINIIKQKLGEAKFQELYKKIIASLKKDQPPKNSE